MKSISRGFLSLLLLIVSILLMVQTKVNNKIEKSNHDLNDKVATQNAELEQLKDHRAALRGELFEQAEQIRDLKSKLAEVEKLNGQLRNESRASRSRRAGDLGREVSRSGAVSKSEKVLGTLSITGYCATGNRTASGKIPQPGMVATISRSIPFGTRVSIEGLGVFRVEDRIGRGSDVDIFFGSCSEARNFGRKNLRVTILKD